MTLCGGVMDIFWNHTLDASPLEGYPKQYTAGTHLYTWVEENNVANME